MSEILILENTIFLDEDWSIFVYSKESSEKVKKIIDKIEEIEEYKGKYRNIKIYIIPKFFRR